MPRTPRVVHAAPGPDADEDAHRTGAHQVEPCRVARAASDDARHGQVGDEFLEIERLDRRGDVLGRDHRPLDHEHVEAGIERHVAEVADPLRGQGPRRDHALGLDLADPLRDQLGLHGLAVDLLHLVGGLLGRQLRDPLELLVGILVARPDALEVEDRQPAELPYEARRAGRDDAVHRGREHRQLEPVGTQRPGDVDVVGVARAARRHDRDVVEAVAPATLLALADLNLHRAILGSRDDETAGG